MANEVETIETPTTPSVPDTLRQLGGMLIAAGSLNRNQLAFALQKQKVTKEKLGDLLLRLGIVTEYDIASLLAKQRGLPMWKAGDVDDPDPKVLLLFNQETCLKEGFLPLRRIGNELEVLLGNADVDRVSQLVIRLSGLRPKFVQATFGKIFTEVRYHYYFVKNQIEKLIDKEIEVLSLDRDHVHSPEVLMQHILHLAAKERATDIHIQPELYSAHISFRIDGVLRPVIALPKGFERLITSIKILAKMDISEQRLPQDGSFSVKILDVPCDVRVSTILTEYGENVVLRLLPSGQQVRSLGNLGFEADDVQQLKTLFSQPWGIILLTGPTGSGKSTTLHAGLKSQGLTGRNIVTVEDPIEYKFPVICQTEVNHKAGYTFDKAIKHFLRHDPDVMLIGEIRDAETARGAITAAETGHLVLSTLHVNNVFGVTARLKSLGIHPHMIANSLNGVVSQRLLRRICPSCRETYLPSSEELTHLAVEKAPLLHRGRGCERCSGTGYFDRFPVYEILLVGKALANAIATDVDGGALMEIAEKSGFRSMRKMAQSFVLKGYTTVAEMLRVMGIEQQ